MAAAAFAQGADERRLAAELVVLAGDVRRLAANTEPAARREGLRARIAGTLAALPLALREAGDDAAAVVSLRRALTARDWPALARGIEALRQRHPFDVTAFASAGTNAQRAVGAAIHREACAGCHDAPAPADAKLPALDLYAMAATFPREEFAARLTIGVRGNASTALRSPFGEHEIAALIAHYAQGGGAAAAARPLRENASPPFDRREVRPARSEASP